MAISLIENKLIHLFSSLNTGLSVIFIVQADSDKFLILILSLDEVAIFRYIHNSSRHTNTFQPTFTVYTFKVSSSTYCV